MIGVAGRSLTAPAWVWNPYHLHTLIMAGIFAVLALSLNLLLGYTGQLSLGHAAFFGIGAYASALLSVKLEWSPWLGLLAAIVLPGLAGCVIGRLALKLRGAYFVLLTISFAGVRLAGERELDGPDQRAARHPGRAPGGDRAARAVRAVAAHQERLLLPGAGRGGAGLPRSAWRLIRSRVGRALVALRENETLAASVGIDATHYLVLAAVVERGDGRRRRVASTRTTRASSARRSSSSPTRSRW